MLTVAKFGGSSLADASQIRKVVQIIKKDKERRVIVVSAPGRRFSEDEKITDMLEFWNGQLEAGVPSQETEAVIIDRFGDIVRGLRLNIDVRSEIHAWRFQERSREYLMSRGEYLMGKILAAALNYEFVDAASCIQFDAQGNYIQNDQLLRKSVEGRQVVVPGFYGALPDGRIQTFSRGGSDLTGAIVARALNATLYENWTDVSGLLVCDPRIVAKSRSNPIVTHEELRELSYMGANVFHEEAMFPVQEAGIETRILNTNRPNDAGTRILAEWQLPNDDEPRLVTGIAGKKDFLAFTFRQALMDKEVGFVRRLLTIFEEEGVSVAHLPSGVDAITITVDARVLGDRRTRIVSKLLKEFPKANFTMRDLAHIAVVGRGLQGQQGVLEHACAALREEGVKIYTVNQGVLQNSILFGVDIPDCNRAIRALYEFFP